MYARSLSAVVCLAIALGTPAMAQKSASASQNPALLYFTDVALVDQDGKTQRLYSDLLHGKIVIINSFFAECKDSCPVMAGNLAKLQDLVGERLGKDVYFLSFSVDPAKDTPEVLKAYAAKMKAKPGWFFLTGSKENVDFALNKLGMHTDERQNHVSLFIIGNEPTGLWKKAEEKIDRARAALGH